MLVSSFRRPESLLCYVFATRPGLTLHITIYQCYHTLLQWTATFLQRYVSTVHKSYLCIASRNHISFLIRYFRSTTSFVSQCLSFILVAFLLQRLLSLKVLRFFKSLYSIAQIFRREKIGSRIYLNSS